VWTTASGPSQHRIQPAAAATRETNPQALNLKNEQGSTPLHWACLNGRADVVKLLMERGACATVLNK
jgi:ankyrin repeat protein